MTKKLLVAFAVLGALCGAPAAADPPTPAPASVLGGSAALAVTASSGRVALPADASTYGAITIYNHGTKDAYFAMGDSTVAATTSSTLIAAGTAIVVYAWLPNATMTVPTHIAAICGGADSTSLAIYQANGPVLGTTSP